MKKIAITGNIAAGKTTVENIIKDNGYKVIDADKICHDALENDKNIISEIKNIFKNFDITDNNGNLDRIKIGNIVFKNIEYKKQLEEILHPFVKEKINIFFEQNINEIFVFASIPLLFETHMENNFDKIIFVAADENIRLERIIKRNNCTQTQALARIKSQMLQDKKIELSDFVINNNGSLEVLQANTNQVLKDLNNLS